MPKITFGPVSSRRFGLSLGLDLSPSGKNCNFDCVYCELKAQKPIQKVFQAVDVQSIIDEVKQKLQEPINFDFITLTANGEPSLYPHLAQLIQELNHIKGDKKLLILSNGTAVLDQDKFNALLGLDVVKFSLDSAIEKSFFRIDRALKSIDLSKMIEKMAEFRSCFKGELVMEVLVVKGINDTKEEFQALNNAFLKIKPTRVDLSSIDRPPAYPVKAITQEELEALATLITSAPCVSATRHYQNDKLELSEEELLKLFHLRPQSELDIEIKLSQNTQDKIKKLLQKRQIYIEKLAGLSFYRA